MLCNCSTGTAVHMYSIRYSPVLYMCSSCTIVTMTLHGWVTLTCVLSTHVYYRVLTGKTWVTYLHLLAATIDSQGPMAV